MEYLIFSHIVAVVVGYLICARLVARRRKSTMAEVIRDTLTIQRSGGNGEER